MGRSPRKKILNKHTLNKVDLKELLGLSDKQDIEELYKKAYEIKLKYIGNKVYFRGLLEFSNICEKDCFYCGIRKSNKQIKRFFMSEQEIIAAAMWAYENQYGSIVLQSGERSNEEFVFFIEQIVKKIKQQSHDKLGITLCLGEQTKDTYQRWFNAGAHRYLLRMETSNKELYTKLHPKDHDFEKRKQCLYFLRQIGYLVGTGVMIGLPGQTIDHLAEDIIFLKEQDIDMIGMGPYIVHKDTPLSKEEPYIISKEKRLELAFKMIAAVRIYLKDINIAATTALQTLDPNAREKGLLVGANVLMPNITDPKYRPSYILYDNKPCVDENRDICKGCLQRRIKGIGEVIGYNEWGDKRVVRRESLPAH